ncbi:response regulator [Phenylobacterium sp.]|jgi:DNA-binding NarL/FixJ family response regulator|uniref:response regulator transcription factor n=1 Tax=Phenylobacterium sp. TaxID=1871053 RepID=UPI003783D2F5
MTLRVLIADDHPLFRDALELAVLRSRADAEVVHACSLGQALQQLDGPAGFDLVLLDLTMSDCSGVEGLLTIRSRFPDQPVAIISAHEDHRQVKTALSLGAAGYIPKSSSLPALTGALDAILAGTCWAPDGYTETAASADPTDALTPAQLRILMDLQRGRLNKQIAFDLGVTEATVKAHLTAIFRKLRVTNRTQAVLAVQSLPEIAA